MLLLRENGSCSHVNRAAFEYDSSKKRVQSDCSRSHAEVEVAKNCRTLIRRIIRHSVDSLVASGVVLNTSLHGTGTVLVFT